MSRKRKAKKLKHTDQTRLGEVWIKVCYNKKGDRQFMIYQQRFIRSHANPKQWIEGNIIVNCAAETYREAINIMNRYMSKTNELDKRRGVLIKA